MQPNNANDVVTPQRHSQFTPKMKANAVPRYKIFYVYDIFLRLVNSSKNIIIEVLLNFLFFDELTNFFDELTSLFDELTGLKKISLKNIINVKYPISWNCFCFHLWCELTVALWCHSIIWSLFFHEIKCNGMTSFMEFM